jgi:hypothetical protein
VQSREVEAIGCMGGSSRIRRTTCKWQRQKAAGGQGCTGPGKRSSEGRRCVGRRGWKWPQQKKKKSRGACVKGIAETHTQTNADVEVGVQVRSHPFRSTSLSDSNAHVPRLLQVVASSSIPDLARVRHEKAHTLNDRRPSTETLTDAPGRKGCQTMRRSHRRRQDSTGFTL